MEFKQIEVTSRFEDKQKRPSHVPRFPDFLRLQEESRETWVRG